MASVKLKFRQSKKDPSIGALYIQLIHNRELKNINTNLKILTTEWDSKRSRPKFNHPEDKEYIDTLLTKIHNTITYLESENRSYSVLDILTSYRNYDRHWLFKYNDTIIANLKSQCRYRSAETYAATIKSFKRFRNNTDIELHQITSELITNYKSYLTHTHIAPNTIIFYMRILRAIYNRAVDDNLTTQRYPFKQISTSGEKTIKRAITHHELKAIYDLDLTKQPALALARDIFMFSFYTRGMSFIDISYLRKVDLSNNILTYRRRKTNQQLRIRWESCMQTIVERYAHLTHNTPYLLPIIKNSSKDSRAQYKSSIYLINKNLKKIATLAGIESTLSTYVARHTWASIAHSKNIPISVISEGMGHDSETTTQIYLASLDSSIIDKANNLVIKGLFTKR
ncbi:MAG: site-specific integrase [Bacteroidales bacterium]